MDLMDRDDFEIGDKVCWEPTRTKGRHKDRTLEDNTGLIMRMNKERAAVRLGARSNTKPLYWLVPYWMLQLLHRPEPVPGHLIVPAAPFCKVQPDEVPSSVPPSAIRVFAGDRAYIHRDYDNQGPVAGTVVFKGKKSFTFQPDFPYKGKDKIKVWAYELRPLLSTYRPDSGWDDDPFDL